MKDSLRAFDFDEDELASPEIVHRYAQVWIPESGAGNLFRSTMGFDASEVTLVPFGYADKYGLGHKQVLRPKSYDQAHNESEIAVTLQRASDFLFEASLPSFDAAAYTRKATGKDDKRRLKLHYGAYVLSSVNQ
jgi:hypothetical protein